MMRKRLWFTYCLLLFTVSCNKKEDNRAAVVFSFDDCYFANWEACRDLFRDYDIKATFFISNLNDLNEEDLLRMRTLHEDGHEIAFHGLHHWNVKDYKGRMDIFVKEEILHGLEKMRILGYTISSYAYPYGASTEESDKLLSPYFKVVRKTMDFNHRNPKASIKKILIKDKHAKIVFALGIDRRSRVSLGDISYAIKTAKENNAVFVLYGHRISEKEHGGRSRSGLFTNTF